MAEVIESQVDWLSCTSQRSVEDASLHAVGESLLALEEAHGARTRPGSRLGYAGLRAKRIFLGVGPQGTLLDVSGDLARVAFEEASGACDHISRLDIAATVRFERAMDAYERERWEEYLTWCASVGGEHRGHYEEDDRRAGSCYVGSSKSDVLLRIYNKEGEALRRGTPQEVEHYLRCHRFELQLRNERACAMAASLSDPTTRARRILGTLAGFLSDKGLSSSDLSPERMALVPGFRRRSDDDVSLGWLAEQVRPTLERLCAKGSTEHVIAALGLDSVPEHGTRPRATVGPQGVWRAPRL